MIALHVLLTLCNFLQSAPPLAPTLQATLFASVTELTYSHTAQMMAALNTLHLPHPWLAPAFAHKHHRILCG